MHSQLLCWLPLQRLPQMLCSLNSIENETTFSKIEGNVTNNSVFSVYSNSISISDICQLPTQQQRLPYRVKQCKIHTGYSNEDTWISLEHCGKPYLTIVWGKKINNAMGVNESKRRITVAFFVSTHGKKQLEPIVIWCLKIDLYLKSDLPVAKKKALGDRWKLTSVLKYEKCLWDQGNVWETSL